MKYNITIKESWVGCRYSAPMQIEAPTEKEAIEIAKERAISNDSWYEKERFDIEHEAEIN